MAHYIAVSFDIQYRNVFQFYRSLHFLEDVSSCQLLLRHILEYIINAALRIILKVTILKLFLLADGEGVGDPVIGPLSF